MELCDEGAEAAEEEDGGGIFNEDEALAFARQQLMEQMRTHMVVDDVDAGNEANEPDKPEEQQVEAVEESEEQQIVAVEEPAPQQVVAADKGRRAKLKILPWGCFTIARREDRNDRGRLVTSFEARCVFHKLNGSTGCKKTLQYDADSEDDVLAALRFWCNEAPKYERQRYHRAMLESIIDVPTLPYELLLQDQITTKPANVQPDAVLDAEEQPAPKRRRRGRGRPGRDQARSESD